MYNPNSRFNRPDIIIKKEEAKEERERREFEKLKEYLKEIYEELIALGIPVDSSCRIRQGAFIEAGQYSLEEVKKDEDKIREMQDRWRRGSGFSEKEEKERSGEKLEMLKTAIFYKFLKDDFLVLRTSSYDDIKNGVDNIIIEKKTGNMVCAIDDIVASSEENTRFKEKEKKIKQKNRYGGAFLKYGIGSKEVDGKLKISLGSKENIPIFYLAISKRSLNSAISAFVSGPDISDFEKKVFSLFTTLIKVQTDELKLDEGSLNPKLKNQLTSFEEQLNKL